MATPTATLFRGKGFGGAAAPSIHETDNGWEGEKWFAVNCDDCDVALGAVGLPPRGSPWSAAFADLVLRERVVRYVGGTAQPDTGLGGACVVQCMYRTIGTSGGDLPAPTAGGTFTYFVPQVGSQQLIYDVRYDTPGFPAWTDPNASPADPLYEQIRTPIAGGRGTSVSVGSMRAHVVVYYDAAGFAAVLPKILWLQRWQSTNPEPVDLPPVLGTLTSFAMAAGQLKYSSCELPAEPLVAGTGQRLLRVTHQLEMAPDFDFRWKEEDQYGQAFGPEKRSQVYFREPGRDSFTGLW